MVHLQHVLIKWTGSKRRQAKAIVARFPRIIDTCVEPFLGGGSVLYELLGSGLEVGRYEVSDRCEPLVALWQMVRDEPDRLVGEYQANWQVLQRRGGYNRKSWTGG